MKIIKYTKLSGGKYKLKLENNTDIILYEDIILKNNLLIIKNIENVEEILNENKFYEVYHEALKYINKKFCSKKDIKIYLKKKNYDEAIINNVIENLEKNNFLNESDYVKAFINDKINFTNDGPNKIKNILLKNGISENLIDDNMELDFNFVYKKLNRLIDKKILSTKNYSGNVLKQKLISYFTNLGYDRRMIEEILLTKQFNNKEEGLKEYNKIFNKYCKKYEGMQLENIIRQKLYLKGFNYDEIKKSMD